MSRSIGLPMQRSKSSRHWVFTSALAAALLLTPLPVCSQEPPDSCLRRTVVASVVDGEGAIVAGLTAEHFRASFRRKPVEILSARLESKPRRIVVMLDASGSMADDRSLRWHLARRVASDLISRAPVGTPVALAVFAKRVIHTVGFDRGREAVLQELATLEEHPKLKSPEKLTGIYDALLEVANLLGQPEGGDSIYLLTDGWDTVSRAKARSVEHALLGQNIRLFAFLLYPDPISFRVPSDYGGTQGLLDLSLLTGGGYTYVRFEYPNGRIRYELEESDRAQLANALRLMEQRAMNVYRLEVELPRDVDKPREWKLELVPREGVKVKELRVVYPRKLLPCETAPGK